LFANLFDTLFKWTGARDLLKFPDTQCMSVYHDDPQLVEEEKLRVSICLTVPEDTQVDGGKYALGRFELDATQYGEVWGAMYAGWLPDSGYQPDDRPATERYLNDPNEHPEGKHIVEIAIPVKPL
jgi:AraC family transcriptional regulator